MTLPRPVIPGQTVMVSRRCTQRQFLLRPDSTVNDILGYCLAIAAAKRGVQVHAFCFMSNHAHLVVTDVDGELPEFCRWFFEFTAKCLNVHWDREENLWSAERPSVVRLEDGEAQVDKAVYAITNPVSASLVASCHHWPGLVSLPRDMGGMLTFKRPNGFFRKDGPMPEDATLRLARLPAFAHANQDTYVNTLARAVDQRERDLFAARDKAGTGVLGQRAVRKQSFRDSPKTHQPRRKLSPRVASRNKWVRIEALQRLKAFLEGYRAAWQRWRAGDRTAVFPFGTYALSRYAGAPCLAPP